MYDTWSGAVHNPGSGLLPNEGLEQILQQSTKPTEVGHRENCLAGYVDHLTWLIEWMQVKRVASP